MPQKTFRSNRLVASLLFLVTTLSASSLAAQPSGPHPRIWLDDDIVTAWRAMEADASSPVGRAIATCDDAHANPDDYADGQYQGFRWVEALGACLVAFETTESTDHRDTALVYLSALLDDLQKVGDGAGPAYNDGVGVVSQDTGYSMRTYGVWAALGYDWLYAHLSEARRSSAHQRFVQWLEFHQQPDTYMRAQPGANYHAGHVFAITLMAIAHASEMNGLEAGSGTALFDYVRDEMWGHVMRDGYEDERGVLRGGDWLEGWQYAPLSVVSYSLAGRALVEQGVSVPWLGSWLGELFYRYVHALAPTDETFVGGDSGDDTPLIAPNSLPLYAVIAGVAAPSLKAGAQAELERLSFDESADFGLLFEALSAAEQVTAKPIDRASFPTAYLAQGAGNYYGRTRFSADAAWFVSQCKGTVVDHQHENAGNAVLSRGGDHLLVDPGPYGSLSTLTGNAPTMRQPHFASEYQPSQGAWGESYSGMPVPYAQSTHFAFAGTTKSSVSATRCEYAGQLRFRDEPSTIVSRATRDLAVLPGATGATMVVVDRVRTTSAYAADPNPLLLRFRSLAPFMTSSDGSEATATVGSSKLVIRRVYGDAAVTASDVMVGDCYSGDRGACRAGRFASYELAVEVAGPNPMTVHLLSADAATADAPSAMAETSGNVVRISHDRDKRRFHVLASNDGAPVTGYDVASVPSTHVVLDPPAGERVLVSASASGTDVCRITLGPATGMTGFASNPLVYALEAGCHVAEDAKQAPLIPPGAGALDGDGDGGASAGGSDERDGGVAMMTGRAHRGGCGCSTPGTPRGTSASYAAALLIALARLRRRRKRGSDR